MRCVLSAKAGDGELVILEQLKLDKPKTKEVAQILEKLGVDCSALVVTHEPESNLVKSAQNLVGVKILPANLLNVVDLLSHKVLLITEAAVRQAEKLWGNELAKGGDNASIRGAASSADN